MKPPKKRKLQLVSIGVFIDRQAALAAQAQWQRDLLRPRFVRVYKRSVSMDGLKLVVWGIVARGNIRQTVIA